jgi:hypothetical protein
MGCACYRVSQILPLDWIALATVNEPQVFHDCFRCAARTERDDACREAILSPKASFIAIVPAWLVTGLARLPASSHASSF